MCDHHDKDLDAPIESEDPPNLESSGGVLDEPIESEGLIPPGEKPKGRKVWRQEWGKPYPWRSKKRVKITCINCGWTEWMRPWSWGEPNCCWWCRYWWEAGYMAAELDYEFQLSQCPKPWYESSSSSSGLRQDSLAKTSKRTSHQETTS